MTLHLIAAKAKNNVIGSGPDIPWQAKGEQKLFKDLTLGGVLIMGRKTFESIGRPLPGRTTIIVTRNETYQQEGCLVATSLDKAIERAIQAASHDKKKIFVAGGGELYLQALPKVDELHLTTVDVTPAGDVYFPDFDQDQFELIEETHFETNVKYTYRHLKRL